MNSRGEQKIDEIVSLLLQNVCVGLKKLILVFVQGLLLRVSFIKNDSKR